MTRTTPPPPRPAGPAGMPPHLWELARADVRPSAPQRVRNATAAGADAPASVRRVAARIAAVGAAAGVPAAIVAVGGAAPGLVDGAGVAPAVSASPLDGGLDPAPAVPGSSGGGGDDTGGGWDSAGGSASGPGPGPGFGAGPDGGGAGGGGASAFTTGTGDVSAGLGTTWRVQEGGPEADGDWLTVQMFQDVTVTETADGMFVVDAWQYVVIRDDDGNEYVFKEHFQVVVPDPPGAETDLVIHERGYVHVIERPDGSFGVVTTDFDIDVTVGSDGDGRDEVGIGQDQRVRVTDADGNDDDVTVTLSEKATSTSDDEGDEAVTTIEQGQVFTDRGPDAEEDPFGQEPAGRGPASPGTTTTTTTTTTTGTGSGSGAAGGSASGRATEAAVPVAGVAAVPVVLDRPLVQPEPAQPAPDAPGGVAAGPGTADAGPEPAEVPAVVADAGGSPLFPGAPDPAGTGPFGPEVLTEPEVFTAPPTGPTTDGTAPSSGGPDERSERGPDRPGGTTDGPDTGTAPDTGSDPDPLPDDTTAADDPSPATAEQPPTDPRPTDDGTGAAPALVS